MKVFIAILILILSLQSLTKADDIRDFEIEGMTIGDSLLDYYESSVLIKKFPYNDKKWASINKIDSNFKTYKGFIVHVKSNDPKYIIGSLEGVILYENNIEDCYKKQKEIILVLDHLFKNATTTQWKSPHEGDISGKSIDKAKHYKLQNGDSLRVSCTDWSDKMKFIDKLKVGMYSKEQMYWINNEAYK
jgi:hypothetical protein